MGWNWSLCPVPTWLAVQRSKTVFFLSLYDSINDMKYFQTVCIVPQPCHIHFCCWWLPIWPYLDVWAENGAYGLLWLGWRYNGAKLTFYWPYMILSIMKQFRTVWITPQPCHSHFCCWLLPIWPYLDFWAENWSYGMCRLGLRYNGAKLYLSWTYTIVSMIWNTSELSASHLSRATAIFVVDCCQFGPSWIFGLKMELMACSDLVGDTTEQSCIFPDLNQHCEY